MNTNYLLDKEGNDKEIERLEIALSNYRFEANDLPRLQKSEAADVEPRRGWFPIRLALGFAIAAAVIVISIFAISNQWRNGRTVENIAAINNEPIQLPNQAETIIPPDYGPAKIRSDRNKDRPPSKARRLTAAATDRRPKQPSTPSGNDARTAKLTKDERYAYDQLLVALWLTGSKLKIVQDTINRVDDKRSVTNKNER